MNAHTGHAISQWLASAHPTPATACHEWRFGGIAMLPSGRAFDTVRISAAIIHAAAQSGDSFAVSRYLEGVLNGPVIHDAYDTSVWYYVLVPLGSCAQHTAPDALRLTPDTTWMGVPEVHRTVRPGVYWLIPPQRREDYCDPDGVAEVIRLGRQRAARISSLVGPTGAELAAIERGCHELLNAPAEQDYTDSITRARGHLMMVLPAIEYAVDLPVGDHTQYRMRQRIKQAHEELSVDATSVNRARQHAHVQRLVRCCLQQVQMLRDLDVPAVAP
ncbi:DUF6415 family natural product biosynthesis protein [Streptomyces sp. NPDC058301]|uniref:DUF6415 family natural product biosynthesis protein n=1 Tax=Streptomyces sp. NPDC058301 TaxID=3346436 RepID=UPI0036E80E52